MNLIKLTSKKCKYLFDNSHSIIGAPGLKTYFSSFRMLKTRFWSNKCNIWQCKKLRKTTRSKTTKSSTRSKNLRPTSKSWKPNCPKSKNFVASEKSVSKSQMGSSSTNLNHRSSVKLKSVNRRFRNFKPNQRLQRSWQSRDSYRSSKSWLRTSNNTELYYQFFEN